MTDAAQDAESYMEFADVPYPKDRPWSGFWTPIRPAALNGRRSPRHLCGASLEEPAGLPLAFLPVDNAGVLREEAARYDRRRRRRRIQPPRIA